MLEFILARYNYWIVIALMMTGLYIVFSRGNLVKTLIGLNLFQTSVFIFYITIGKVMGGTAPILIEDKDKDKGAAHGAAPGDSAASDHASTSEAAVGFTRSGEAPRPELYLHDTDVPVNDISGDSHTGIGGQEAESLHLQLPAVPANELLANSASDMGNGPDAMLAAGHAEVIYSNPLPHVLILTAIVVGVATTAVGLALAVRIREAYGTVEEDQLEAIDNASDTADEAR